MKFSPRKDIRDRNGEWWAHPSGAPVFFLHHCGPDKNCFDSEQLESVLSQGGQYRPGATIRSGVVGDTAH
jgi:hypothetical protein